MFNSVEYIREICAKRKIPISQIEKDCGFSNGYLNPKKLRKIPYERAVIVAKYLDIPVEVLLDSQKEEAPAVPGKRSFSDDDMKFALWGDCEDMDDEDLADVRRYAAFIRERKKGKK